MKRLLVMFSLLLPVLAQASEAVPLEHAPINSADQASLQRGARIFVNYCLNCHSAAYMRYNRLSEIGISDANIKANLLFTSGKVGEVMKVTMSAVDAKAWFGLTAPDLSVEARARTADWLYSYLRGFYRDNTRPMGWNNTIFPNVAMPNALWQLQGQQVIKSGAHVGVPVLVLDKPGSLSQKDFDATVADLVNYLVFMAEPGKQQHQKLGLLVLLYLSLFFVLAYFLKKEFWKDIH
jgi:ubiquinol-cytochrome c reductase cytochrome c1 subunit